MFSTRFLILNKKFGKNSVSFVFFATVFVLVVFACCISVVGVACSCLPLALVLPTMQYFGSQGTEKKSNLERQ